MPGMSVQVDLSASRLNAPLVIPADALVIRSNGSEVAVVGADGIVHIQKIQIGRDYGDRLEVSTASMKETLSFEIRAMLFARERRSKLLSLRHARIPRIVGALRCAHQVPAEIGLN